MRHLRLAGRTEAEFNALPAADQSMWWAHAIRQVRPGLQGRDGDHPLDFPKILKPRSPAD